MFIRLILLCVCFAMAQQRVAYLFETEEQSIRHYWEMNGSDIVMTRGTEYQRISYSESGHTQSFTYSDTNANIHYVAKRSGARIIITGSIDGEAVTKEFEIDSDPWYQSVHDFSEFARGDQQEERTYWVIRPSDMKIVKMQVQKVVSDNPMEYSTVVASPAGIYAKFWKGHYSYRNCDGLFVKFRCKPRIPGATETVISLLNDHYVAK